MSIRFIGVDAGGTRTRALLATESGEVVGSGRAAGANSWSSGTSVTESIEGAVAAAVGSTDPGLVAAGVVAIAGGGSSSAEIAAEIDKAWGGLGLGGSPAIVIDVVATYAAGTTEPRGLVLTAGTGAIAAVVSDGSLARRAGGHGWLVGDEGSAVWLGARGTQAALRVLDGRGPATMLATTIPDAFGVDESDATSTAAAIVDATYSRPPARIGRLAPLVVDAGERGDAVAAALVVAASDELAGLAAAVMGDERPRVIVLGGSMLTGAAPVNRLVRTRLGKRWPRTPMVEASSGEAGAVALAIGRHAGAAVGEATLTRLRSGM